MGVTSHNAVEILKNYDIIADCTDAPSTRYLISDAAVVLSKPLVSGSALGTEGIALPAGSTIVKISRQGIAKPIYDTKFSPFTVH